MAEQISFEEFRVDLAAMASVISTVKAQAGIVEGAMAEIRRHFAAVETAWRSPSASSFADLATWFDTSQTELSTVLGDMTGRLESAYATYHEMEQANLNTLAHTSDPPPGTGPEAKRVDPREQPADTPATPAAMLSERLLPVENPLSRPSGREV